MNKITLVVANTKTKKLSLIHSSWPGRMEFIKLMNDGITEKKGDPLDYVLVGIVDDTYTWETKQ